MSTYLPTGSSQIPAPKSATEGINDALKRAKEIAAKLTGKSPAISSDALGTKRNYENDEEADASSKRSNHDPDTDQNDRPYVAIAPTYLKTTIEFIVPGYKVGLIIGTRGETLKKIERDSETKITFDPLTTSNPADMPERRVMITGLPEDCERSKRMVLEKIHAMVDPSGNTYTTALHGTSFTPSSDPMAVLSQMPVFKDAFGNPLPSVQFMIPNGKVGLVIGKGGETIRDLQERSGAKVFIAPDSTTVPNQQERLISISGSDDQISAAKQLLEEILEGMTARVGVAPPGAQTVDLIVPDNMVGLLIGKRGEYFKLMAAQSRAKIVIDPPVSNGTPTRIVSIIGSPESIAIAQQMIHDKLEPTNRLEGNTYYPLDGSYPQPTSSYYGTDSSHSGAYTNNAYPSTSYYSGYSAMSPAAGPTSSEPPKQYTKEQIDYYYAYYYDYYSKAGLDSNTAIQASLSAMAAAGIPYPTTSNNSPSSNDTRVNESETRTSEGSKDQDQEAQSKEGAERHNDVVPGPDHEVESEKQSEDVPSNTP